jgi:hypothetical protein
MTASFEPVQAFLHGAKSFDFDQKTGSKPLSMGKLQTEEETHARFDHVYYEIRGFGRTIFPAEVFDYVDCHSLPRFSEVVF